MMQGVVRHSGNGGLEFVVPGERTSINPFKAFKQGLSDESAVGVHDISKLTGHLCSKCGFLELYVDLGKILG